MHDGWTRTTLGTLARQRADRVMPEADSDVPYLGLEHIESESGRILGVGRAGDTVSLKTPFEPGDILYGKLRPALRKVLKAPFCGVATTEILAIQPREQADAAFVHHVLHSDEVLAWALRGAEGTKMPRTSWQRLARFDLLCPPPSQRAAIGATLDSIDEAIERTEEVVAATEKVRKALLQDLLTRGIPGWHSEWKTVPGIGAIPACWDVVKLGEVAEVQTGRQVGKAPRGESLEVPYLSVANVKDGYLHLETVKRMRVSPTEVTRFALRPGDVLFTEGGDRDKLGRGAVWNGEIEPCLHQNHVFAVRPGVTRLSPWYLTTFAGSAGGKAYFMGCAKQTTNLASINSTQLKALPIPLPQVREQTKTQELVGGVDRRLDEDRQLVTRLRAIKRETASALLSGRVRVPAVGVVA